MADDVFTDEKSWVHRLIDWFHGDPMKVRRWVRSFLAWLASIGMMVITPGIDAALAWGWRDWAKRLGVAAIFGAVGAINLGQKNVEPEATKQ